MHMSKRFMKFFLKGIIWKKRKISAAVKEKHCKIFSFCLKKNIFLVDEVDKGFVH